MPGVSARRIVFVGSAVFPYARAWDVFGAMTAVMSRAVFVDPPTATDRFFAIDAALRCPGVGVVIADGRGVDMATSRRFQLAATAGGVVGVLIRPGSERKELSAAATRWVVSPCVSPDEEPRWTVDLLRCKGLRPTTDARRWTVRLDYGAGNEHPGAVRVVAEPADRPDPAGGPGRGAEHAAGHDRGEPAEARRTA